MTIARRLLTLSALLLSFVSVARSEQVKTIGNPWTGKPDYITALTSGTIPAGATNYIWNTPTLQSNSTFYVTSGTVRGQLSITNDATLPGMVITETTGQTGKMTEWKDDSLTTHLAIDANQAITDPSSTGLVQLRSRPNMGSFGGDFTTELKRDGTSNNGNGTVLKFTDNNTTARIEWRSNSFTQNVNDLQFFSGYGTSIVKVMTMPASGGIFVYNPVVNTQDMSCVKVPSQDVYLGAGTPTPQGSFVFDPLTLRATSPISLQEAASLLITGAPLQGSNMTLTTRFGALIYSGDTGGVSLGIRGANGQTADMTQWQVNGTTPVYVSSIGIVGVSTLTAVRQIRWADGTIQVSSPTAGASGSFINNQETLQSGATFYVSSGTVQTFNVNTNGSGATANINGTFTVDRPDLGSGAFANRGQMVFEPLTSGAKLTFRTYNAIGPDPQIAWYDNSGFNYAYISVPPSPTSISMRVSSNSTNSPLSRWAINGNSYQSFSDKDQLETFRLDVGSASLRYGNQLQFNDNGNNFYTAFRSTPTGTYNQVYYLPTSTGSAGQVLSVNKVYGDHVDTAWITPSAGSGDNLGNHLATTTLSMQGFSLTNIGTSSSVFGTNGNLTVNSSATFVSTVTFNGVSTTTYSAGTALDMTAATFVLPTAASPPTNAVGQFGLDTTDSVIVGSTGTTTPLVFGDPMVQFTATISTDSTSVWQGRNVPIWQNKSNMDVAIDTITATTYSASASTLAFQLQSRPYNALNSNGTNIFTSTQPATWTGWTTTSFSSATIRANNYLVFFATTTTPDTGTVNSIIVSVRGRKIVR